MIEPRDIKEKIQVFRHSPQQPGYKQNLLMNYEEPEYIVNNHKDSYLKLGAARIGPDPQRHHDGGALDNPILANGFYYFMTIIVVLILVSAILFGIREYSFAFRRRIKSSTSEAIKLTNWNDIKGTGTTNSDNTATVNNLKQQIISQIREEESLERGGVGGETIGGDRETMGVGERAGAGIGVGPPILMLQNNLPPVHQDLDLSSKNNAESGFTQFMEKIHHQNETPNGNVNDSSQQS
ncbi:hypothetical protein Cantr_06929 [Candida viswanathii]|uniref:Uncharacterized protein n=1 Tax=Candida viswanathii TaxID=5486 RepID=A0A367XWZ9_9ASCO|nr:hypothetical protein Cantr_06929 [Candida viswanathii]